MFLEKITSAEISRYSKILLKINRRRMKIRKLKKRLVSLGVPKIKCDPNWETAQLLLEDDI